MRIYFVGSHATGKTTMTRWVSRRYGLPMITEVARSVLAEKMLKLKIATVGAPAPGTVPANGAANPGIPKEITPYEIAQSGDQEMADLIAKRRGVSEVVADALIDMGEVVIDGSVRGKLARLAQELAN